MALHNLTLIVCIIVSAVVGAHSSLCNNNSLLSTIVLVNSSRQLKKVLNCFATRDEVKEFEVVLDHTKRYQILWEDFIYFTEKDITIRSSSRKNVRATLHCNGNDSVSSSGLAFANSSVKLMNLHFISCGADLSKLPHATVDMLLKIETSFCENNATLLFISSKLNIIEMNIEGSKGFAISAINLLTESSLEYLKVYNSVLVSYKNMKRWKRGSGVFLFFSDDTHTLPQNTTVSIKEVVFMENRNVFNRDSSSNRNCLLYSPITNNHTKSIMYYAAGLTIRYTQHEYFVQVTVDIARFQDNIGQNSGAVLLVHYEEVSANTVIQNSVFESNAIRSCYGKDLLLLHLGEAIQGQHNHPLVMGNSSFFGGLKSSMKQTISTNAIAIGIYPSSIPMHFYFKNLQFTHHNDTPPIFDGLCMRFQQVFKKLSKIKMTKKIRVIMENIRATENAKHYSGHFQKSLFYYKLIKSVTFSGYGKFEDNYGSVIHAEGTNLYLTGNMTFINNTANKGAAIHIHGNVQLYFMPGLQQVMFMNNNAYYMGGAIYAKCGMSFTRNKCAFQFSRSPDVKTKFIFRNNVAQVAGNSIFATPISDCQNGKIYEKLWLKNFLNYFNLSLNLSNKSYDADNGRLALSTSPNWLLVKYKQGNEYKTIHNKTLEKFPGEDVWLRVSAHDKKHRNVFSYISLEVFQVNYKETERRQLWIQQHQLAGGNVLLEQNNPTNISFSIHTDSSNYIKTKLVMSIPDGLGDTYYINLKSCPLGFGIDQKAGACHCSSLLKHHLHDVRCYINERIIKRVKYLSTWIGLIDDANVTVEAMSHHCPYCDTNPQYEFLRSMDHGFLLSDYTGLNGIPICMNNRIGVLCGHCDTSNNYSLVFGSSECKQCSNLWLITIIGYSIIGPLLVYILYALRLTITVGTLNGAIFYVQAANAGLIEHMTIPYTDSILNGINHVYRSIFLFLNLNLGIPLCFYNGMDQLWKTGLGLVFPVYLLLIVVCVIIISRYSTWVSNRTAHLSVQVLVTVVHLSFSKLLETLIEVFTAATVYTADPGNHSSHFVWYWDGSVEYLGSSHLLLTAVTTAIVSLLLIPYIGLLAFGRRIMKCSKRANLYLRPVIETAYAPYKEGKQHWFVLRLILLIIIYILYVLFRTGAKTILNISMIATLASFTVMKAFSRPYKNNAITVVDCWLMVNITIVYTTLWSQTQSTATLVFNTVLVSLGLLTIGGILLYHILQVTKYRNIIIIKLLKGKKYIPLVRRRHNQHSSNTAGQPIGQQRNNGSRRSIGRGYRQFTDSSCQHVYREPLITEIYCDPTAPNSNDSD